jgi:hypothetical protein
MSFTSAELPLPLNDSGVPFARVDLHLHDLDHSGQSYEGRVFFNHPDATLRTARSATEGYAGSFYVFGHPHCWGDAGHCDVPPGPLHAFDSREPHHLVPELHTLDVTDIVRDLLETAATTVTVTILPVVRKGRRSRVVDGELSFRKLALVSYD